MNDNFVIEEKYNLGVGLINVECVNKLVKHFEFVVYIDKEYTIDVYENGLVKCNYQTKISNGYGCSYYVDKSNQDSIGEIFSINITNNNKLDDIYIKLIEDIYRPFCERQIENACEFKRRFECDYDPSNKDHIRWWGEPQYGPPSILLMTQSINANDYVHRNNAFKQTFEALKTIKIIYEINNKNTFIKPKQIASLKIYNI
jgi:hypothetical protein